ncbi:MAG: hypothetical protein KKH95_04325 [Gammaproteobacteria bacterium]|nr:hypothetical protein [Gammaproteobacteria bacterium]
MTSFKPTDFTLQWITAGGTLALDVDWRNWNYTPSVEKLDETAGHDTNKSYIAGFKDGQASASGLLQAGSAYAYATALTEGQAGTLVWRPEGSAAGKYSGTAGFMCDGLVQNQVYNSLVEWSTSWTQNGPRTSGTL